MPFSKHITCGFLIQFIFIGSVLAQVISQDVIASSGDHFTNDDISLSWTLGEPIIETVENGNVTLTQGFHQPKIFLTAIKEPRLNEVELNVFPNPAVDIVNIDLSMGAEEIITVQLYNMKGEKLISKKFQERLFQLDLSSLASANYLLSLRRLNGELITTYLINKTR